VNVAARVGVFGQHHLGERELVRTGCHLFIVRVQEARASRVAPAPRAP
jgi:hypothetical protein